MPKLSRRSFLLGAASALAISGILLPMREAKALNSMKIGQNMGGLIYSTTEQPFLNIVKNGALWACNGTTTGSYVDKSNFNLDDSGYFTDLVPKVGSQAAADGNATFSGCSFLVLNALFAASGQSTLYPSGTYAFSYEGAGTLSYTIASDCTGTFSGGGRDVLTCTPSQTGIRIFLFATDPGASGNNLRNFRLVQTGTNETLLNAGEIFNPAFITKTQNYNGPLRLMDWNSTNTNNQVNWSDRAPANWFSWGDTFSSGFGTVPYEVMAALGNKLGIDIWVNMPVLSTATYWSNAGALFFSGTQSGSFTGSITTTTLTTSSVTGKIYPGDTVFSTGFATDPIIIAQLTGTKNGAGTYQLSASGSAGSSAMTSGWPALSSARNIYVEDGNEVWQFTALGLPAFSEAVNAFAALPGLQNTLATFTGFIDNGAGSGSPSGVAGTVLTCTASCTGIAVSANNIFGSGVTSNTQATASLGGNRWTINNSQLVNPAEAMTQGDAYLACCVIGHSRRSVLIGQAFRTAFSGSASRVKRVLGLQFSVTGAGSNGDRMYSLLASDWSNPTPTEWSGKAGSTTNMDYLATAPYFLSDIPGTDTLTQFFALAAPDVTNTINVCTADKNNLVGLGASTSQLITYEGGQSYYANDANKNTLYAQANNDSRMYDLYFNSYLPGIQANCGYFAFVHLSDGGQPYSNNVPGINGNFGVWENVFQTTVYPQAPKYNALMDFINQSIPIFTGFQVHR